jgi:BirA family biotin operon repressor/biotin-[acetyl-CoA-carboxylase] ligase
MSGMPGASTGASGALPVPDGFWSDVRLVASTGSTNADVLAEAGRGAPEGLVIAAEEQTAGRGRQGRRWISRPGAALMFSMLLRPREIPQAAMGWVPLLAGVATANALRDIPTTGSPGLDARLKWPNDILIGEKKLVGILAEQAEGAIAVGIGINVLGGEPNLPVPTATSLELHHAGRIDPAELLADILRQFERWYLAWRGTGDADACGLRAEYLRLSATVGQRVRVHLPAGRVLAGIATDVDDTGRLLVRSDDGEVHPISAGDVIHVR